jgi:4-amino-4-deoxy-L-arabinose transferase-like glycosyltransferase
MDDKPLSPNLMKQTRTGQHLRLELELPPDSDLEVVCNYVDAGGRLLETRTLKADSFKEPPLRKKNPSKQAGFGRLFSLPTFAFILALIVYLTVRLVGLEEFPIYFFSDEAIQSVHAADLIRDQFYSPYDEFLPTFFENGGQYNLSTSVYYQVLPVLLFGKQIWATRGAAVLLTLLAALGVGLMIEAGYQKRRGWLAVLVLSLMPAWFLHSRTAFETSMAVSFYAGFVAGYVLYRKNHPRYLYATAVLAALAFYSYSPMRVVVGFTLLGMLLSDWRYHWHNKRVFLIALGMGFVFLLPYLRFSLDHPGESLRHLEILGSYWVKNIPFGEKLLNFVGEYLRGLNPLYWYLQNQVDLPRHLMKNYGHLWQPGLPFLLMGIVWCFRQIRQSFARLILLMLLAAPSGAAMLQLGITRTLVMVIPATVLTTIGLLKSWEWLWQKVELRRQIPQRTSLITGIGIFVLLILSNTLMGWDALRNGSTWFENYGLYGMQYGARQVFGTIENELQNDPDQKFYLTSVWTNGADVLARFFFEDPVPFQMGSIDGYISEYKPFDPQMVFVITPEEKQNMEESQKFTNTKIVNVLPYPNGEPGFYFMHLEYVDNIEATFAAELAARRMVNKGTAVLADGEEVWVEYSTLDMGEIMHIFDGDQSTLARTWEANPLRLIVHFSRPRPVAHLVLRVGGEPTRIEAEVWAAGEDQPLVLAREVAETSASRLVELDLPEITQVQKVEIRVTNLNNAEPAHVHLWELQFYPLNP